MILALHTLGETYGVLPSAVMAQASTIDLYIMDAALSYRDYRQKIKDGKVGETFQQEDLQAMLAKVRGGA